MKRFSLIILLIFQWFNAQNLTIDEATFGQYRQFAPKTLMLTQWIPDTHSFTYISSDYQQLMQRTEKNSFNEQSLISKVELENAIKKIITDDEITLRTFPMNYQWIDKNSIQFQINGKQKNYVLLYDFVTKNLQKKLSFSNQAEQQNISPNQNSVAYTQENNIFIADNQGNTIEVTTDTNKGIVNGSDYVHRQEFGIDKGMWWNKNENKLLYYRKDETMVGNYPLTNWNEREATENIIKYPMAGMKSEEVTLVVYDVNSKQKTTLQTGEPKEQFLTSVTWSPDGNSIFVGVLNREQNHLKFNEYNANNGNFIKTLFKEKAETYVEPLHPITFIANTNQFLYRSEREGFEQLYLYNTDGKLLKKLGYKDVVVADLLNFDTKNENVFYTGTANNGLDRQLYKVNIKSGKTEIVTNTSGTHNANVTSDGMLALDNFNNISTPNNVSIINLKSKKTTTLLNAENPFNTKISLPKMELLTITSADGKTPLNARIIYPLNFDATKKYPVMLYVYGGPHAQLVNNEWLGGASLFDYFMAQNGYIVFTLDNRGSDARGKDFEHIVHRKLGQNEMQDQMKGIDYLTSKSFVDKDKIGVYGWSFGGFMTISLMLNHNDIFKVGVAGGPVCDWKYYEVMYGERYMDTPQENQQGYEQTSVINKAKNLNGKLLVIHGAQDPVVVQQNSMNFIQACIENGKQVDYFLYPTHEHNVRGKDRVHLNQKIFQYFETYLK